MCKLARDVPNCEQLSMKTWTETKHLDVSLPAVMDLAKCALA
jgi:hypothetical protein